MSIEQMRLAIAHLYGGDWPIRVANMPDKQVVAIYNRKVLNRTNG
jgi:hypothetical protein